MTHNKIREENLEANLKPTKPNPTKHRIMSSKVLGEDTGKIRNSLEEIDTESDIAAGIRGRLHDENKEWLNRSAIAISHSLQSSESILKHILSEGVNCLIIKSMGGMQHLLIFDSLEDKRSIIDSQWLDRLFMAVRDVNRRSKALWRKSWINKYVVPLVA